MSGSRLLWVIVLGFLGGVALRSFFLIGIAEVCFLVLLVGVFFFFAIRDVRYRTLFILSACILVCVIGGVWRMSGARLSLDTHLQESLTTHVILLGTIIAEPDEREDTEHLTIEVHTLIRGTRAIPVEGRVLALVLPHAPVFYGDDVRVSGTLEAPQDFEVSPGRSFDYPGYLAVSGVGAELMRAQVESVGTWHGNPLIRVALSMKHAYLHGLATTLPQPESSLAGGITVGDKRSVGTELSNAFQRTGLVHVLVLSGYNITVVASALARILSRAPQVFGYLSGFVTILFFIVAAGGASSAVRSGILAGIGMLARISHRRMHAGNALLVTALVMVAWNPYILVFDPSFQYAMLAALALVYVAPLLESWCARIPSVLGVREVVIATCATQSTVMPLMLYQSGLVSVYALPANIFVLMSVPAAMFFSALAGISGMLVGSYAVPLAAPAYALLWYIVYIVRICAALPFAGLMLPPIHPLCGWLVYVIIVVTIVVLTKRNRRNECDGSSCTE